MSLRRAETERCRAETAAACPFGSRRRAKCPASTAAGERRGIRAAAPAKRSIPEEALGES